MYSIYNIFFNSIILKVQINSLYLLCPVTISTSALSEICRYCAGPTASRRSGHARRTVAIRWILAIKRTRIRFDHISCDTSKFHFVGKRKSERSPIRDSLIKWGIWNGNIHWVTIEVITSSSSEMNLNPPSKNEI